MCQKHLFRELSSSWRILEVLCRTQSCTKFHCRWLLWRVVLRHHCFWETLIFIFCEGAFGWSCFPPGEIFNQFDRSVHHNSKLKEAKKMPNVGKKSLLRKMFKRHYSCSNQKLASTQSIGSAFLQKVRKVQNSKYEHDFKKITDCFFWWLWICKWLSCQFFLIEISFDNQSFFFHVLRKLPKKTQHY